MGEAKRKQQLLMEANGLIPRPPRPADIARHAQALLSPGDRRRAPAMVSHEFELKLGVTRDAPFLVAFQVGDLFATFEPEEADQIAFRFTAAAQAARLARASRQVSSGIIIPGAGRD